MAKSPKGAAAPAFAAASATIPNVLPLSPVRDCLDRLDTCARALEGLLNLIMPYTTEEAARGTLLREDVSFALDPLIDDLRQAIDAGWALLKENHPLNLSKEH